MCWFFNYGVSAWMYLSFIYVHTKNRISQIHIEKNYNSIISERLEILELSNNLKKIKQMNEMVRHSLGANLEIDEEISIVDSTLGLYEMPEKRISRLQNIPSDPPIEGFISQDLSDTGHFLKEPHYGIDIVAKMMIPLWLQLLVL